MQLGFDFFAGTLCLWHFKNFPDLKAKIESRRPTVENWPNVNKNIFIHELFVNNKTSSCLAFFLCGSDP